MQIKKEIMLIEGSGTNSNGYLISGKVNVLVDTGTEGNFERILPFINNRLDLIVNTHCHYDHSGCNRMLRDKFSCKIAAHEADAKYIEAGDVEYTCASLFKKPLEKVPVDLKLKDGEIVPGTCLEVVHTPGHTEGSICLYDRKNKILFSGDTIFAGGNIGRTDLAGGSYDKLISSIAKLSKLDVDILLPGHGKPLLSGAGEYIKGLAIKD